MQDHPDFTRPSHPDGGREPKGPSGALFIASEKPLQDLGSAAIASTASRISAGPL
jgi:hypothetical protein